MNNIIISGLTAAGKTTHSHLLCEEHGFHYISASRILLGLAGLDAVQPLDFWVSPKGIELSKTFSWKDVDTEFQKIERASTNTVFDCQTLPWLQTRKGMSLWIDSSLESRVFKARVSYAGQSTLSDTEIRNKIIKKDELAQKHIFSNYGVDLFQDRKPFDLIIDISSFITEASVAASHISIRKSHEIIDNAVRWYLYGDNKSKMNLDKYFINYGEKVIIQYPQRPLSS
jgi:cytidylate kinase